jgi:hypothetical protein
VHVRPLAASNVSFVVRRHRAPRLYSAGDSHADTLSGRPGVKVAHVGPVTAFRAGRRGELTRLFAGLVARRVPTWAEPVALRAVVRPRDRVLLCFGEIDVRAHFARRAAEYDSVAQLSAFLAERLAAEARELAGRTGAAVGIASVTPPAARVDDPGFPTHGTVDERVAWTRELNRAYGAACRRFGVVWVDAYDCFADRDGRLRPDVSDGAVHVRAASAGPLYERVVDAFGVADQAGLLSTSSWTHAG